MDPHWQRVRQIFEHASDLPAAERGAFLDQACAADASLRAEVESLLKVDATARFEHVDLGEVAPDLLGQLQATEDARSAASLLGQRLGVWRLVRELGRGGMGTVYLAERDDGQYRQQAAIKLVRPGWDLGELLQRLRAERQILASLNHPNIARLLDGGMSDDGKPYLVLEYVDGELISDYCDAQRLAINDRLRLFLSVCEAVAHAHRCLVVHRDLKPSNILVDQAGRVKLLDFGIAKLLQPDAMQTASALRMFTPEYAAPEQVRGEPVTTGVDIYALGLLLFELLTGRRPYANTGSTPAAYEQAILTQEPARPSRAALGGADDDALARSRQLDPSALSARLRGDLDAIVLKALRKDPAHRYAAVADLAEDVSNFLAQKPVDARRGNLRYRATRFLQRHALSTALALVALCSLVLGLAGALWQAQEARQQRDLASAQAHRAEELSRFLVGTFSNADPYQRSGTELSAKALLDRAVTRLQSDPVSDELSRLALLRAMAQAYFGLGLPKESLPLSQQIVDRGRALPRYPEWDEDLLQLAINLRETGEAEAALPIADQAIAIAKAESPPDQQVIARALYLQGMANFALKRREQSDILFDQLLLLLSSNPGLDPRLYDDTRLMVSRRLGSAGDFGAAEKLVQAVIADLRAGPANREIDLISALDALGSLYDKMEKHAERVAVYRELLPLALRHLGPDHFHVGIAYHNFGQALASAGQLSEALAMSEQAVRIGSASVGADHSFSVAARVQLANTRCKSNSHQAENRAELEQLATLVPSKFPNYAARLQETFKLCAMAPSP